jgi:hypothetical protein
LLCDFNIDLFKYESHHASKDFVNQLFSKTRINGNSCTLIDNIYTNVIDVDMKNGISINDISDHLPIYTLVKYSTSKIYSSNKLLTYRNIRLLKEFNIEMLSNRLRTLVGLM